MRSATWASVAISAMVAFALARPASAANKLEGGTASVPCGEGQVVYSPIQIWPPNHKMVPVATVSVSDAPMPSMVDTRYEWPSRFYSATPALPE